LRSSGSPEPPQNSPEKNTGGGRNTSESRIEGAAPSSLASLDTSVDAKNSPEKNTGGGRNTSESRIAGAAPSPLASLETSIDASSAAPVGLACGERPRARAFALAACTASENAGAFPLVLVRFSGLAPENTVGGGSINLTTTVPTTTTFHNARKRQRPPLGIGTVLWAGP